ncbi:uncharacterized protein LOC118436311 [Folsomia candida]|uniref:uncharacterized protein LOC118436311 n=1 Tax=Folsomia candida TaxID=158441 RepID=UPI001604BD8F|nr:uncharacterized protein LOC118436311 [Folsomia candida]
MATLKFATLLTFVAAMSFKVNADPDVLNETAATTMTTKAPLASNDTLAQIREECKESPDDCYGLPGSHEKNCVKEGTCTTLVSLQKHGTVFVVTMSTMKDADKPTWVGFGIAEEGIKMVNTFIMICRSSEFKNKTATTHWASGSYFPEEVYEPKLQNVIVKEVSPEGRTFCQFELPPKFKVHPKGEKEKEFDLDDKNYAHLLAMGTFNEAGSIPGHSVQFRYLKEGGGSGGESDSGSSPQPLLSVAVKVLLLMMIWGCYGM